MPLISINPATGRILRRHRAQTAREVAASAVRAEAAFREWRRRPFAVRARHLRAVAGVLRGELEAHARLITAEMGKPIAQARAEIEKCALVCDHYARHAAAFLADERPPGAPPNSFITFQPLGGAGRDAVEFPLLAGVPRRRAGAHGRQHDAPQARLQRLRLRAAIERFSGGRLPGRRVPDRARSGAEGCPRADRAIRGARRDADRQHRGRPARSRPSPARR